MTDGVFGDRELWQMYVSAVSVIVLVLVAGFLLVGLGLCWQRRRGRWERRMRRSSEGLHRVLR